MKKKNVIVVPEGIRYISQWQEFYEMFPRVPHIMNKSITGCGFTEWCLTNQDDVILCSPRNILLQNKTEQHPGEVYRVVAGQLDVDIEVDKDTTKIDSETDLTTFSTRLSQMAETDRITMMEKLASEIDSYCISRGSLPKKILVTYDSFRILKEILIWKGIFNRFQVIIDESQSIFMDANFKADTELEFVETLQDIQKVCYLSATPMLDEYLERIDEFKDLPYYELDWETGSPGRTVRPDLIIRTCRSIYEPAKKIIKEYLAGKWEKRYYVSEGVTTLIESKEAVLYVNSVVNICDIIKKTGLNQSQTNILCAKTDKNERIITKRLGKGWTIGRVPLRDEPRKMFTFCTRTVYLGADFYSPCARSFIFSDTNIECLVIDISLDLPQILGRQRLEENPWKTAAEFYYRPLTKTNEGKLDPVVFEQRIKEKIARSEKRIQNFEDASYKDVAIGDIVNSISYMNYREDYVSVNRHSGPRAVPVINNLVLVAEQRAFDIQQRDYRDRFTVIDRIYDADSEEAKNVIQVNRFFAEYDELTTYRDRIMMFCNTEMTEPVRDLILSKLDDKMKSYLSLDLGRLKAVGYQPDRVDRELGIRAFNPVSLKDAIYQEFSVGDKIPRSDLKEKLKNLYTKLGYQKTAKSSDIQEWFEVRPCQRREGNQTTNLYELLSKKK